jgi:hypothetical protein
MRPAPNESSHTSSERRGAGLLVQAVVFTWAAIVYVAYWLRYLPASR